MLAILAVLVLTPSRILPEPFIDEPLQPILPVRALEGVKPVTIARGSYWRADGFVRLTYYYRLPPDFPISHKDLMEAGGFREELTAMGEGFTERAAREAEGIQQWVRVQDIDAGTTWPWANLEGPARVVIVSESPYLNSARWHRVPKLLVPPFPPGFPPNIKALAGAEAIDIRSDPIIPRNFRSTITVQVRLGSSVNPATLADQIESELPSRLWNFRRIGANTQCTRGGEFGLRTINVGPFQDPEKRFSSIVLLIYVFDDSANAPRLLD
jgi:hypothetical protein